MMRQTTTRMRVPAGEPAVETYPCIGCGEVVEAGRARLGSVPCHDCGGREDGRRGAFEAERRAEAVAASSLVSTARDELSSLDRELSAELYRSRRYQRPFVLASISRRSLNGHGATARADLTQHIRAIDRVWEIGDRIFLLLPETDRHGADQLIARLADGESELLPRQHVSLAAFPDDGLTSAALLAAVTREPVADPAAPEAEDGTAELPERVPGRLLRVATRFRRRPEDELPDDAAAEAGA